MNRSRGMALAGILVSLALLLPASAQLPIPDLQTIFPQGAQAGTPVEVTISGSELEETSELVFSHPGIRCERIVTSAATEFRPEAFAHNRFLISAAPDVPPGVYEVTARTRLGFTAPRAFVVGLLPEVVHASNTSPESAQELPLNTVMNGHADPSAIDHYKIALKRDQRVIISCRAEVIDSRMDATLSVSDSKGHEFLRNRDTIGRDPVLDFIAPRDDTYLIRVYDFTYRGGSGFPYRLTASDAPHIDFVDPPAGQPGTTGRYKLYGRNLPGGSKGEGIKLGPQELESVEVEVTLAEQAGQEVSTASLPAALLPGMTYRLEANGKKSNPVRIGFAAAPVVRGEEGKPQAVPLPSEIHGRFERKGDLDQYLFEGSSGSAIWIECIAGRLGRGSDPVILVEQLSRDQEGNEQAKQIASNDDFVGNPGGNTFPIRTRDAALRFVPPADATYRVNVLNQTGGGAQSLYRLIVRPAQPDFDLVVTPWDSDTVPNAKSVRRAPAVLRQGGTASLRVFAMRRDGFNEAITLAVEGLPAGVSCPPVRLAPGKDSASLILHSAPDASDWQGFITIKGTAGETTRNARASTIAWSISNWDQDYTRTRMSLQLPVSVCSSEKAPVIIKPAQVRYEIELNGQLEIPFTLEKAVALKGDFTISPSGLPHSKPPQIKIKQDAAEGKLTLALKPTNEFKISEGEWTFSLHGNGTIKHRNNLAAVAHAEAEQKKIDALEKQLNEEAQQAKATLEALRKSVQEAENNLKTASGDARATLEAGIAEKKAQLGEAEQKAKAAEEKSKQAAAEKKSAADRLKQANDRAKEKDMQHGTHSQLITVVVKPPPPKEDGK